MRRSHGHSPSWPSRPRTAAHTPEHPPRALTRLRLRGLFADGPAEAGFVGSPRSNTRQAAGKPRISCLSSEIGKSTRESHEHIDPAGFRQIATDFRSDADQKPFSAACRPLARALDGPVLHLRAAPRTFFRARQIGTATSFAPACPQRSQDAQPPTNTLATMRMPLHAQDPCAINAPQVFRTRTYPLRTRCLLRYVRRSGRPPRMQTPHTSSRTRPWPARVCANCRLVSKTTFSPVPWP